MNAFKFKITAGDTNYTIDMKVRIEKGEIVDWEVESCTPDWAEETDIDEYIAEHIDEFEDQMDEE